MCKKEDAVDPAPCDKEIFKNGVVVAIAAGGKFVMEGLVREACRGGLRMDWHYAGGRAMILSLDDPEESREALRKVMPQIQFD